jgi:hypothetical protein
MGSMSVASATDLSEAIKGVQLGGYLRLRVYHESDGVQKYKDKKGNDKTREYTTKWRTTAALKFTVPVSEELKFHANYAFDWSIDNAGNGLNEVNGKVLAAPSFVNVHMFADYKKDGAGLILGKIPVKTPVTGTGVGEAIAAGFVGTYKVQNNLTVAVAGLDDLVNTDQVKPVGKNTYAAAAIYNSDIADVQAWYFNVDDIIDSDIVVSADVKALKANGVTIHVDYAQADLSDNVASTVGAKVAGKLTGAGNKVDKTQTYFNLSATYKQNALCAKVGYAVTGKDGGIVTLDHDSPLANVLGTEQKTGITDTGDNNALYANVTYKVDGKTSVKAAYSAIDNDSANEILVGANYAYTKKFNVYAYYSILSADSGDNNEARLELKYKF